MIAICLTVIPGFGRQTVFVLIDFCSFEIIYVLLLVMFYGRELICFLGCMISNQYPPSLSFFDYDIVTMLLTCIPLNMHAVMVMCTCIFFHK